MTAEENDVYRYDAFISYNHRDREWVQGWLLPRLEDAGLRVCIDFRDFELGLPTLVNMENAVEHSRKTLIVLTPDWVESEWTTFESLLIQTDDPAGRRARIIPLRLRRCEPPRRIAMLTCVDFTQTNEAESQLERLVAAIGGDVLPISPTRSQEPKRSGWLVRTLQEVEVPVAIAGLVVAILACVGTYLAVPQVQEFIASRRTTPIPSVTVTHTPRSTMVDMYPFYVYRDNDSPDNHFSFWDGIMEDGESIGWGSQIDYGYSDNCHSGSTCMRIAYTPDSPRVYWVGISWQYPQGNWGTINEGFSLERATTLKLWARGEKGGESVTFGVGGLGRDAATCDPLPNALYPDSVCPAVSISPVLSTTWQQYSIDLADRDLGHVIMGFLVSIDGADAQTIFLDEIRYEDEIGSKSEPQDTMTTTVMLTPTLCPIYVNEAIPYDGHAGSSLETAKGADPAKPDAIKITFENPDIQSFSSWVIPLHTCDATTKESLSFWVRGENGGEQFEVGIRDSTTEAGHEPKVKQIAPAEWQQVFIPLQEFQELREQDLSSLENFSLGFSYDLGSGTIYVDGFTFSPP